MAYISDTLRQQVTERAKGRCEYCQTQEIIVVKLEIDHIVPDAAGGETTLDNLCLACTSCNNYKADHQSGRDPETGIEVNLFNPRHAKWTEHFAWSDDGIYLLGLTPTGRATVARLQMNNTQLVKARRVWVHVGWHPPKRGDD